MKCDILRSKLLVLPGLLVVLAAASACSERAREESKEAAQAVADDTKAGVQKAAEEVRDAAGKVADATERSADRATERAQESADRAAAKGRDVGDEVRGTTGQVAQAGTDGWITAKVKTKFLDETILKGSAINVDTVDHVVTLKGTVLSAAGKKRAEDIARGTDGVTRVINELLVKI